MRFSIITAIFASAAMAQSTVYTTEEVTITSCAPTVTNCPAASTVVSLTSYPVLPTKPAYSNHTAAVSVVAISTCVPTVIYSTVTVAPAKPTAPASSPAAAAPAPAKNATSTSPVAFTGAASSIQGSLAFAAVAGVAAFLFA